MSHTTFEELELQLAKTLLGNLRTQIEAVYKHFGSRPKMVYVDKWTWEKVTPELKSVMHYVRPGQDTLITNVIMAQYLNVDKVLVAPWLLPQASFVVPPNWDIEGWITLYQQEKAALEVAIAVGSLRGDWYPGTLRDLLTRSR